MAQEVRRDGQVTASGPQGSREGEYPVQGTVGRRSPFAPTIRIIVTIEIAKLQFLDLPRSDSLQCHPAERIGQALSFLLFSVRFVNLLERNGIVPAVRGVTIKISQRALDCGGSDLWIFAAVVFERRACAAHYHLHVGDVKEAVFVDPELLARMDKCCRGRFLNDQRSFQYGTDR